MCKCLNCIKIKYFIKDKNFFLAVPDKILLSISIKNFNVDGSFQQNFGVQEFAFKVV